MNYRNIEHLQDIQTDIDERINDITVIDSMIAKHLNNILDADFMVTELEKKRSSIIRRLRKDRNKLKHEINRDDITDEFFL